MTAMAMWAQIKCRTPDENHFEFYMVVQWCGASCVTKQVQTTQSVVQAATKAAGRRPAAVNIKLSGNLQSANCKLTKYNDKTKMQSH